MKPPIGLMPKWLHDEIFFDDLSSNDREREIIEAINRYKEINKPIPQEWILELDRIIKGRKYN